MRTQERPVTKFRLGVVLVTPGALAALVTAGQEPSFFLAKHAAGDWGCCCADDRLLNDQAVKSGDRILSVYHTLGGERLYVVTECDRSVTTLLLPEEY